VRCVTAVAMFRDAVASFELIKNALWSITEIPTHKIFSIISTTQRTLHNKFVTRKRPIHSDNFSEVIETTYTS
jgi:hypothetical protein